MPDRIQRVKGTHDILPKETSVWAAVEAEARDVFALYGYSEIRTPILEPAELFVRSVGESTDIVGKEMYTFVDKGGRSLALRPENTAAVARAYVEHGMQSWPHPVKLFYMGPQFRYERPQRGRQRQFYQIGAEYIGDGNPAADAELLLMLLHFFNRLGFSRLKVLLNTVGDESSRFMFRHALLNYLEPRRNQLGEDSRRRLDTNPLRILDTKDPAEQELLTGAPRLRDYLSPESERHFLDVCDLLDRFRVQYELEPRLVRGLDYYTHLVFEIVSERLGAQNAIVGGGAYDDLIKRLGGPRSYGIGFAIGEERLIEVLPDEFRSRTLPRGPAVVVAAAGESTKSEAAECLALAEELRQFGIRAVADLYGRSLGTALKWAARIGSSYIAILGAEELASGEVTLKDLTTREEIRVPRSQLFALLPKERR